MADPALTKGATHTIGQVPPATEPKPSSPNESSAATDLGVKLTYLTIPPNLRKKVTLVDNKYFLQVERYVGQVQILLYDSKTRLSLAAALTSETNFSRLVLQVASPQLRVDCVRMATKK